MVLYFNGSWICISKFINLIRFTTWAESRCYMRGIYFDKICVHYPDGLETAFYLLFDCPLTCAILFNVTGIRVSSFHFSYPFDFIKRAHLLVQVNFMSGCNSIFKCLLSLVELWRCRNELVLSTSLPWASVSRINPKFLQACPSFTQLSRASFRQTIHKELNLKQWPKLHPLQLLWRGVKVLYLLTVNIL